MGLYKRGRSDFWWITYSVNGKRYRESTGTTSKRQAEAVLAKRTTEVFEGKHFPDKKKQGLTMAGLRELWLAHARHKRSLSNDLTRFEAILDYFGAQNQVDKLTRRDIEAFRDALSERVTRRGKKMAPATVNRHLALLRASLKNVQGEYLNANPMDGVRFLAERNKRERECEPEEYDKLREGADPDLRLAITLAYEAGLRRVEIARARHEHINLRRRELLVPASSSKTDTPRKVPLTRVATEAIRAAGKREDGKLLSLEPDHITSRFINLCARLGIEKLTFHDLRGTAITRLARVGASLDELQKFSGHKSIQALMRYLKRADKRLRSLVDALDEQRGVQTSDRSEP